MDLESEVRRLAAQVAELSRKAQAAEDYIAISNLQRAYGYYVDKARWDDAADLFAKDCTLEINGRGVYVGQDRVRQYMMKFGPARHGALFNHMQLQPVIHIAPDGLTAQARWRASIQVGELGKTARWGEGTYENAYAKEDGVWKIKRLHFYQTYYIDYYAGWDKGALPLVPVYPDFPPDRPPSEDYKVFPDFYLPPYHYQNPVSGRG
ncbi:MAG TPA: nuclear transport factor 2 family protein [Caulobacteraceae bacterium]